MNWTKPSVITTFVVQGLILIAIPVNVSMVEGETVLWNIGVMLFMGVLVTYAASHGDTM